MADKQECQGTTTPCRVIVSPPPPRSLWSPGLKALLPALKSQRHLPRPPRLQLRQFNHPHLNPFASSLTLLPPRFTPRPLVARSVEDIIAARGVKPTLSPNLEVLATVEALAGSVKKLLFIGVGCQVGGGSVGLQ